jgi:hypothetical protein
MTTQTTPTEQAAPVYQCAGSERETGEPCVERATTAVQVGSGDNLPFCRKHAIFAAKVGSRTTQVIMLPLPR